ncbi:unnamed protein product [Linum trigynum]|uniref:Endonuclease/exonuclease/phosphatase domain-containing protein n=1 Tax=Linum trigynum TaxID=586398 RepID=A0AAV2GT95_9ROSI
MTSQRIEWQLSAVYGNPAPVQRRELWSFLRNVAEDQDVPWLLAGDFNSILSPSEKLGGANFESSRIREFQDVVNDIGLHDLGYTGPHFTWFRTGLRERLDRAMANSQWLSTFPETTVRHLPRLKKSNHRPILTTPTTQVQPGGEKPFRVLAAWLTHEGFMAMMENAWAKGSCFTESAAAFARDAAEWNRTVFGHILRKKDKLLRRLEQLELAPSDSKNANQINQIQEELELILFQEELLWYQKSRMEWIKSGDMNTAYFHARTIKRRKRNRVSMLKNSAGEWVDDPVTLLEMARSYFHELYTDEGGELPPLESQFPYIIDTRWVALASVLDPDEIRRAVQAMGALKSPGKDGLNPLFFQRCWDTDTPKHNTNLRPSVIADRECSNRQVILSTRGLDLLLTQ